MNSPDPIRMSGHPSPPASNGFESMNDPDAKQRPLPLEGLRVIEFTHMVMGPTCGMVLADLGAEVIKIEPPGEGDHTRGVGPVFVQGESAYFLTVNRNKTGVVLDLKHPEGRSLLEELAGHADVIVDNFRPGTLARMGMPSGCRLLCSARVRIGVVAVLGDALV